MKNTAHLRILFLPVFIGLIFTLGSCREKIFDIENTKWYAQSMDDKKVERSLTPYMLEILPENKIVLHLKVNKCYGSYTLGEDNTVEISDLGCTEMCCDTEEGLSLADMLVGTHKVNLEKDKLTLTSDKGTLTFVSEIVEAETKTTSSLRFQTFGCFGSCPSYIITIYNNGLGDYVGRRFVKMEGRHKVKFDQESSDAILQNAASIDWSKLKQVYLDESISDSEYIYLDYEGYRIQVQIGAEAPESILKMINDIKSLVKTTGYIDPPHRE